MAKPSNELLDPRQREAAALIMSAIDLPAPAAYAAKVWMDAAVLCPGITLDAMAIGNRKAQLQQARYLIDTIIQELP
ncbi:hypothetical protein Q1W73_16650 [Asticcacaulis sp. ZE23SCel15]|uniref:hypothetical protein n=1 Tax=Asticcacaulis sp. ZE23SCel15 TaxID=3059027 RepID=UPI00265F34C8|nr:hypothetical protein [Asticcacaulis sp. ZE23SCel15]WKL57274.1 hypothetical protein Q1W73_16650 [Asticcacaulis sp. ZE23SCel15]